MPGSDRADWSITPGEDIFFAHRLAQGLGIPVPALSLKEQYYLQGLEPQMEYEGRRWIRLASLYPETINYVDFHLNGQLVYTAYVEPFTIHFQSNWRQRAWEVQAGDREWMAMIHLREK